VKNLMRAGVVIIIIAAVVGAAGATGDSGRRIIEQTEYWASPGKAEEVYQWRLHACDVRERIGLPRGRVLRRHGESSTLPDIVWQIEYPNEQARLKDLQVRDQSPEFKAVRDHMDTLIRHFERGFWVPEGPLH
jgi:hypothetical protein